MAWGKHKNGEHRLLLTKQFALGKSMLPTFRPMMLAATRIWNSCVWESRETYKQEQRWPTEGELKAKLKTFAAWRELNCQSAQAVVEEYAEAVASYLKHQENGHSEMNKPDFKSHKVLRTVTFKQQRGIRVHKGRLYLRRSWGKRDIPIKLPKNWNHIQLPDGKTYIGTPVEVKIKAIGRRRVENLILHVTFDLGSMQIASGSKSSAYDYNAALIARLTSDGTQDLFITREIPALQQYRNKKLAELQARRDRCKEHSRRWNELNRRIACLCEHIDRRIQHMLHCLTKAMVERDVEQGVTNVLIGDLTDIRRKARTGDKSKKANQKINQLPFAQIRTQQVYKSLMRHIEARTSSERFSSTTCAVCGHYVPKQDQNGEKPKYGRVKRGLWSCPNCGLQIHADLNGAANILKIALLGECRNIPLPFTLKPSTTWHWCHKTNQFVKVSHWTAA